MGTKDNTNHDEEIFLFKKNNHCTLDEVAEIFHISRAQVEAICQRCRAAEKQRADMLYDYVGRKTRVFNALRRAGILSVAELEALPRKRVEMIYNIGKDALEEIYMRRDR